VGVNVISVLMLVALIVLFAWLTQRAWAVRNAVLKWIGVVLAGLVTGLLTLVTIVAVIGFIKLYTPANNPVASIQSRKTRTRSRGVKSWRISVRPAMRRRTARRWTAGSTIIWGRLAHCIRRT